MSSLEEQLALFEQEISSVVEEDKDAKAEQPIQAPDIGGSSVQSTTTTRFVPHQLRQKASQPAPTSHQVPPVNAPRFLHSHSSVPNAHLSSGLASSATIESGPTLYSVLYAPASTTSSKASSSAAAKSAEPSSSSANPASSSLQQQQFKTLALPSDVELLLAKKQASKAHENSYLGAVLRGEKKMKRFVRSCGGQVWEDASMAEWDPNDFRIFCGDLGNEVSDELLAKAFRKYPSFQKAKVVRDSRTNKSKGYGFVSFRSQEDFIRAMKEMDGKYVGNRPIKLRKSNWKDRNVDIVKKKNKEKKKLGLI